MRDAIASRLTRRATVGPDRARLFEITSEQGGYFTAEQARACGYSWALLSHHMKNGRFVRVRRGRYRYREYPSSPREEVLAAWLAVSKDIAVVLHDSALDLLDLSDVIPDAVHLTVPLSRRNHPTLPGVRIHTTVRPLRPSDLTYRDGMVLTSATRTILDVAEAGTAPDQVELAVAQALERGLAVPEQLRQGAAERSRRVAALIEGALHRVLA
ncbi:MAG: type IV toxin-antitoxin system AbiEi family antitoxin domain-containing protein [Chloroflexi bacterium]|nr:type IV toxin-antitoxin system AbiEi family antitoxin domain-containing protein [Chloroflexota bacterium]